jgi:hypothetical protein
VLIRESSDSRTRAIPCVMRRRSCRLPGDGFPDRRLAAMHDADEIRRAVTGTDAAREGAPPGEDDQRQFLQRPADQHLMKNQRLACGEHSTSPGRRLDDVRCGNLRELLQAVRRGAAGRRSPDTGRWRAAGSRHTPSAASCRQAGAGHGRRRRATSNRRSRAGGWLPHLELEAVAGDREGSCAARQVRSAEALWMPGLLIGSAGG